MGDYADSLLDTPLREYLRRCRRVTIAHQSKEGRRWTWPEQMLKIHEEAGELHIALRKELGEDPINFEICDIMLAALTMFHVRGADDRWIAVWLDKTLQKIEKRVQLA